MAQQGGEDEGKEEKESLLKIETSLPYSGLLELFHRKPKKNV